MLLEKGPIGAQGSKVDAECVCVGRRRGQPGLRRQPELHRVSVADMSVSSTKGQS